MSVDNESLSPPVKVLFLAWGYSIHARRRIQLFIDDSRFRVIVVSTHNYAFDGAANVLLTTAQVNSSDSGETIDSGGHESIGNKIKNFIARVLRATHRFQLVRLVSDLKIAVKDYKILKAAVGEFQPDIVFLQTLLYPCYLSYFLPRSIPTVITFWNGDVIWWAKWNGIERLLKKQIVTYGVRRAAAMTVNSQMAFDACLRYGTQKDKVCLIRYPGVDLEHFRPLSKIDAKIRLNIGAPRVVLWPRGLGSYLNSDIMLQAAQRVIEIFPDTLFVFLSKVGEAEMDKHRQLAKELGIADNCKWVGQILHEEMPLYYACADVVVSISSNDSLPNVMLEAMACGRPVIMGDIPQIREWVQNNENGYLVPCRDPDELSAKIIKVFENPDKIIDTFIAANLALVRSEVDSVKNIEKVKSLVLEIAGNGGH